MKNIEGQKRVVIEHLTPQIDGGLYPVKRTIGETLTIKADVFADGHDWVSAFVQHKKNSDKEWTNIAMMPLDDGLETHIASLEIVEMGVYEYRIKAFINHPISWQHNLKRRLQDANRQDIELQMLVGIEFLENIKHKAKKSEHKLINLLINDLNQFSKLDVCLEKALGNDISQWFERYPTDEQATFSPTLVCLAQRKKAGFSTWYSFFPRSASQNGTHGTFADCQALLPRIAQMGFDVVYLPPIHPIGVQHRKGKNNAVAADPNEVGCPYGIGLNEDGHKAILVELGTLGEFKNLVKTANDLGIEIAMDYALQCSPDHPYVNQHPKWFKWRPDGTVQYAENPPKKYQDILPINFENDDWQAMWQEFKSIFDHWIACGVNMFRVDNPHTKSFVFWQWVISEINKTNPDVLFLAEAFTRPRITEQLAKVGFQQSYTYFTWRYNKAEMQKYVKDLTTSDTKEYMRPCFWTNTHDINPYYLQTQNEAMFILRYAMAATLSANTGIFGPCFELMDSTPFPGKEEYWNSEKYEVRHWDWNKKNLLTYVISKINQLRHQNEALQYTNNITFCDTSNENLMAYVKTYKENRILCVVNWDVNNTQNGTLKIPLDLIGKHREQAFFVHDLLTGYRYQWHGEFNFIELNPAVMPCHIFRIEEF